MLVALEMASRRNRYCASCIGALSFPMRRVDVRQKRSHGSTRDYSLYVRVALNDTADRRRLYIFTLNLRAEHNAGVRYCFSAGYTCR